MGTPHTADAKQADAGAYTHGFSVAAIPVAVTQKYDTHLLTNNKWGENGKQAGVGNEFFFESDSGPASVSDLDNVDSLEKAEVGDATGRYKGLNLNLGVQDQYSKIVIPKDKMHSDEHSENVGLLAIWHRIKAVTTTLDVRQVYLFRDNRTGAVDVPIKNSGFQIWRQWVYNDYAEEGYFTTRVTGKAVTVTPKGSTVAYSAEAGKTDPAAKIEVIDTIRPPFKK